MLKYILWKSETSFDFDSYYYWEDTNTKTNTSNSREVSEQSSRFTPYDAYESTTRNVNFKSEIGEYYLQSMERRNANLSYQAKGGLQKVDNERYLIDVMDTIEVHASTGIEFLKVKGREGYGTWFLTSEQGMLNKLQDPSKN